MATTLIKVKKGDDPKTPLSPLELAKQNQFAKSFAARKGLLIGQDAHVGPQGAPFVDPAGNPAVAQPDKLPPNTITDIRKVPSYVTSDKLVMGKDGLHYFEDSNGDMVPLHPDIVRSARFNPNRGTYDASILAYAKNK